MRHLKALLLYILLSPSPALAAGVHLPTAPLCTMHAPGEPVGTTNEAVKPSCPLVMPPICRLTDPTCALFWLLPLYASAGQPTSA